MGKSLHFRKSCGFVKGIPLIGLILLQPFIAAVYNLNTNNYRYFPMSDNPFCSGHIRLLDETILIVGGDETGGPGINDGRPNIRRFVPGYRPYYNITDVMQPYFSPQIEPNGGGRWYPTLITLTNGNVLIVSGAVSDGELPCS